MHNDHRYQEIARRLAQHGYDITLNGQGYLVINRSNPDDVSRARHLDDLEDLAKLMEWRTQHLQGNDG